SLVSEDRVPHGTGLLRGVSAGVFEPDEAPGFSGLVDARGCGRTARALTAKRAGPDGDLLRKPSCLKRAVCRVVTLQALAPTFRRLRSRSASGTAEAGL